MFVCRDNFLQSPAMVNAWYQPERNSITFPYAAWNPPYYNFDYPQAYNFAGQGGTGGHELTHGYDDEGVQFGFNGELTDCAWNKCGWMDTQSSAGFIDMAQCVVTQFSTQCCPEKTGNVHCANGATTQGENIADLGGQQAAYRAYRQYIATKNNGVEEDRLPGLESYTPNQIFWITYGYSWCMKQTDANLVHQVSPDPPVGSNWFSDISFALSLLWTGLRYLKSQEFPWPEGHKTITFVVLSLPRGRPILSSPLSAPFSMPCRQEENGDKGDRKKKKDSLNFSKWWRRGDQSFVLLDTWNWLWRCHQSLFFSCSPTHTHRPSAEPIKWCRTFQNLEKILDVSVEPQCTQSQLTDARSGLDSNTKL